MTFQMNWEKMDGLIPAIIQNIHTQEVLMLGYMNQEALQKTIDTKQVTFYSRSKQRLWAKGEISQHYLKLYDIQIDCDQDAILVLVEPSGPVCHTGSRSCFGEQPSNNFLYELSSIIKLRKKSRPSESYVSQLLKAGTQHIAQKVGEEGVETALEAVAGNNKKLKEEMADLIFHLMVLMEDQQIELKDILDILKERHQTLSTK